MHISNLLQSLRSRLNDPENGSNTLGPDETETVRRIVQHLNGIEPERARYIAAFAYILSRVARADMNISEADTREMERQVMKLSGIPAEEAVLVVQIAKTQATLFGGTENFLVTQEFNKIAIPEQKLVLLDCLFAVAAADQVISSAEDREIRLICDELLLTHEQFIAARYNFRQYLGVLKSSE